MTLALQEPSRSPLLQLLVFLFIFPVVGWKRFLLLCDTWTLWKVIITRGAARQISHISHWSALWRQAIRCWGAEMQQLIDNHCLPLKVNHTPQTMSHHWEWGRLFTYMPFLNRFSPARFSQADPTPETFLSDRSRRIVSFFFIPLNTYI